MRNLLVRLDSIQRKERALIEGHGDRKTRGYSRETYGLMNGWTGGLPDGGPLAFLMVILILVHKPPLAGALRQVRQSSALEAAMRIDLRLIC